MRVPTAVKALTFCQSKINDQGLTVKTICSHEGQTFEASESFCSFVLDHCQVALYQIFVFYSFSDTALQILYQLILSISTKHATHEETATALKCTFLSSSSFLKCMGDCNAPLMCKNHHNTLITLKYSATAERAFCDSFRADASHTQQ